MPRLAAVFLVKGAIACWLCMVIVSPRVEADTWVGPSCPSYGLLSGGLYFVRQSQNAISILHLDGRPAGVICTATGRVYHPCCSWDEGRIIALASEGDDPWPAENAFSLLSLDLVTGATDTIIAFPRDFWPDYAIWMGKREGVLTGSFRGVHHWRLDRREPERIGPDGAYVLSWNREEGFASLLWKEGACDVIMYRPFVDYYRYNPLTGDLKKWRIDFETYTRRRSYWGSLGVYDGSVYFIDEVLLRPESTEAQHEILAWDPDGGKLRTIYELRRGNACEFADPWAIIHGPWHQDPPYLSYSYLVNVETRRKGRLPQEWVSDIKVDGPGNPVLLGEKHIYVYDKETLEPKAQYEVVVPERPASSEHCCRTHCKWRNTGRLSMDLNAPALDTVDLEAPRSTGD